MSHTITPLLKQTLADNLAQELKKFIVKKGYYPGHKLPSTSELAQRFGVGLPTLREAVKKLEAIGAIEVKHGSGIYVGEHINSFFLMNPIYSHDPPTRKQLIDLIEARISIEVSTVALAAENADTDQIEVMENLLQEAKMNMDNDSLLNQINMRFHRAIASASGNLVFEQIMRVLSNLFHEEQLLLIDIFRSKEVDHRQHLQIFKAIKERDTGGAARLMKSHLEGVREAIKRWNPEEE
jgi:GntR family transcriptional repressor for pyruvate dehydrogenase complex